MLKQHALQLIDVLPVYREGEVGKEKTPPLYLFEQECFVQHWHQQSFGLFLGECGNLSGCRVAVWFFFLPTDRSLGRSTRQGVFLFVCWVFLFCFVVLFWFFACYFSECWGFLVYFPPNDEKHPSINGILIVLLGNPQYPSRLRCFKSAS